MADLKTRYLGLELKNPIIVGSSALTKSVEGVQRAARAGAGAVVLKSLFEEELRLDYADTMAAFVDYPHAEAAGYLDADLAAHYGPEKYLQLVADASAAVDIPVIASVNCVSAGTWPGFARKLESAGAAGIELNIYVLPMNASETSEQVEQVYVDAVKAVRKEVSIPVAVKLVPYITNLSRLALRAHAAGANGLVLFNRFFHPDIDLDKVELKGGLGLSSGDEYLPSLRWIGILYGRAKEMDLCASTGVHDGATALKQILAGASAVQVTSALYRNGYDVVGTMLSDMAGWMDGHGYADIPSFRGTLSRSKTGHPEMFERAQYIKSFVGAE